MMSEAKSRALADELCGLQKLGASFAIINESAIREHHKDIDLVWSAQDKPDEILRANGFQPIYPKFGHLWVKFLEASDQWIVLDISNKYKMISSYLSRKEIDELINRSRAANKYPNIKVLTDYDYCLYLILKGSLQDRNLSGKHQQIITNLISKDLKSATHQGFEHLYCKLPRKPGYYFDLFNGAKSANQEEFRRIRGCIRKSFGCRANRVWGLRRVIARLQAHLAKPKLVAIIGPDGSGKSSVVSELKKLPFVSVKYMGPGQQQKDIIPTLKSAMTVLDYGRHRYQKGNPAGIIFRLAYLLIIYLDLNIRYLQQRYGANTNNIIFFDRFIFDVYIRNPDNLRKALFCKLSFKPQHVILLKGNAEEIYARKPELTVPSIERTYSQYHRLFTQNKIPYSEVASTGCSKAETLNKIMEQLVAALKASD